MRAVFRHTIGALTLGLFACGGQSVTSVPVQRPQVGPPLMAPDASCAAPPLNRSISLGSRPLDASSGVVAAFDGKSIVVGFLLPHGDYGLSTVMLSAVDCTGTTLIDSRQVSSSDAQNGLSLTMTNGRAMMVWNAADQNGVSTPHARAITVDSSVRLWVDTTVTLMNNQVPVLGSATATALVSAGDGYYLGGSFMPGAGGCQRPFLQQLDSTGAPVGSFIDVDTSGFGQCVNGSVPLSFAPDGSLFMAWLASQQMGSSSVNNLSIPASVLATKPALYQSVPSTEGVTQLGFAGLGVASAKSANQTVAAAAANGLEPWAPKYLIYGTHSGPSQADTIQLSDTAQPYGDGMALAMPTSDGTASAPFVVPNSVGGMLGWTLLPAGGTLKNAEMFAQRFAYNGLNWSQGPLIPLLRDGAKTDRHLQALLPISDSVFFMVWTQGAGDNLFLYGQFISI